MTNSTPLRALTLATAVALAVAPVSALAKGPGNGKGHGKPPKAEKVMKKQGLPPGQAKKLERQATRGTDRAPDRAPDHNDDRTLERAVTAATALAAGSAIAGAAASGTADVLLSRDDDLGLRYYSDGERIYYLDRDGRRVWYDDWTEVEYRSFCPPGLAKKDPPCVPPGLAGGFPYRVGDRIDTLHLDDNVIITDPGRYGLDPAATYYLLDDHVMRVDPDTREVLALIGLASALLGG